MLEHSGRYADGEHSDNRAHVKGYDLREHVLVGGRVYLTDVSFQFHCLGTSPVIAMLRMSILLCIS